MVRVKSNAILVVVVMMFAWPLVSPSMASAGTERYVAITSVPYIITSPGGYKLVGNLTHLAWYTPAISIQCDNVVLDLDGFTIVNATLQAQSGLAAAITASGRSNVTVRNGKLRGFPIGIQMTALPPSANTGAVVEDIGIYDCFAGPAISLENVQGGTVRRCSIVNTTTTSGALKVTGRYVTIRDNSVARTHPDHVWAAAIDASSDCTVIEGNAIANDGYALPPMNEPSIGIRAEGKNCVVIDNQIAWMYMGITYGSIATGSYRDNIVFSCIQPYTGGTDAGNNH